MHLKSIKVAGFKSFCDPQTLSFNHMISCVVGPNGCGKSNIIDAVKWVIGESSAKSLRGEQMTDVIFNGSSTRSPVGQAQVELIFDNSSGRLQGEWAAYQEISIKRIVYRDGQSSYFLNQTRCRKKDITDLFLGTGLGARSYAIIEQGMVSKFIDAKPQDIRMHVEEAAGISKYKDRRKETLAKLEDTSENLNRISDLKNELEKRVAHLHEQAVAAKEHQQLKANLARARQDLFALQHQKAFFDHQKSDAALSDVKLNLSHKQNELDHFKINNAHHFRHLEDLERQMGLSIDDFNNSLLSKKDHEHALAQVLTKQNFHKKALEEIECKLVELDQLDKNVNQALIAHEEDAPDHDFLAALGSKDTELNSKIQVCQKELQQKQQQYKKIIQLKQEPKGQVEVLKTKIEHIEQQALSKAKQVESLLSEQEQLQKRIKDSDFSILESTIQDIEISSKSSKLSLDQHELELNEISDQLQKLQQESAKKSERLKALQEKKAQLEKKLQALDKNCSQWLSSKYTSYQEVFKNSSVKNDFLKSIASILSTQYLYHVDRKISKNDVDSIADKDIELCWGDPKNHQAFEQSTPLPDYFHELIFADTFESGYHQSIHLKNHQAVVFPNGAVLGTNWFRPARIKSQTSLAELQFEYQELTKAVDDLSSELLLLNDSIKESILKRKAALEHKKSLEERNQKLAITLKEHQLKLERQRQQFSDLSERIHSIDKQIDKIKKESADQKELSQKYRNDISQLVILIEEQETSFTTIEADVHHQEKLLNQLLQEQRINQQALNQERNSFQHWEIKKQKLVSESNLQNNQILQLKDQRQEKAQLIEESLELVFSHQQQLDQALTLLKNASDLKEKIEKNYQEAQQQHQEITKQQRYLEKQLLQITQNLHQIEMDHQKNILELRHLEDQILDFGWDIQQISELKPQNDLATIKKIIAECTKKIDQIGSVNLMAIEEHTQENERLVFVTQQYQDIDDACTELKAAIHELDLEIEESFNATFHKLRDSFETIFPILFGGGQATLLLEDASPAEENKDPGVIIKAQPPGKKNANLAVLSGGEKALTASALVFSFFKLNPAPFCLMDEVDAPLDDSNTLRLAQLVKRLSADIQFIVVTHSKITMEQADTLFGVTMREPGVSRLVDVDMKKVMEFVEG